MIRRSILIASTAVALTVAGCGGKKSTPTPTPSPSSSSTPSPTPVSYSKLPLAAAVEMFTVSAATSYTGDLAGPVTLGTAGTDGFSNRVRLTLQSDVTATTTAEEVVLESALESRFKGADLLTPPGAPATGLTEYAYRTSDAATGKFSQLERLNNTIKDKVTTDVALGRSYVSYAAWWRGDSTAGQKRVTYGTFGYPTVPSDMPNTGSSSYIARIAGRVVTSPGAGASNIQKLGGTVTVLLDYATGLVTLTLNLTRADGTAYGTYTGTGAIASGNNQFTGSFGPGSPAGGTFQGLAYGPKATELGITFAITGADSRAVGVVIGRQG
jgi:hypothetical protein